MKTHVMIRIIAGFFLMTGWMTAQGQRQMEVPGDNFSLEGALELFKKSSTPEEFERLLNYPDSKVNNLDLNGDGYIDYIRVINMQEGNVHAFILQAVISDRESQDIAVITLEKLANGKAVLQITGDEDIYGVETIIEPTREVRTYAGAQSSRVVVNVWAWPSVQYIYGPYYSAWVSPWGWYYRPVWWSPWRPVAYYDYYPYWRAYRPYYSVCYTHRVIYAHQIYRPYRTTSVTVYHRHNTYITNYRTTRIEETNRVRNDGYRSNVRQNSPSVRYDTNGRIVSEGSQRTSAASSATMRSQTRSNGESTSSSRIQNSTTRSRSTSELRSGTNGSQQNNAGLRRSESTNSMPENSNNSRERATMSNERNGSSSTNPASSRSYSNTSGNSQRSSTSPNVQQRSSGSSNVQKSTGSSNARQSSGNTSVQPSGRSSSAPASSSRSGSSVSPNVQRSSGSANVQRSSGNASVQKSTGSSNAHQSSGSSGDQRSSGNSGSQQSSGRSSGGRQ